MADHSNSTPSIEIPDFGDLNIETSSRDSSGIVASLDSTLVALETEPASPQAHPTSLYLFRPLRLAKLACAMGALFFLPILMRSLPDLTARSEYQLKFQNIQLVPAPHEPVPATLISQVYLSHQLPADLKLLDPKLCQSLSAAFSDHPWIARVVSVEKSFPAAVVVHVEYRRPVAMIQIKGGCVPIDTTGTVLPSEDFGAADVLQYPTIRVAGSTNLGHVGRAVKEPGITGAVELAELLGSRWETLGLAAIELPKTRENSQSATDIVFRLQTKTGSSIIWGRAPGTDHPGELSATQKVARLEKYLAEFGGFDRPNGPYEIDIRHWQEITRRPVGKSQTSSRSEPKRR